VNSGSESLPRAPAASASRRGFLTFTHESDLEDVEDHEHDRDTAAPVQYALAHERERRQPVRAERDELAVEHEARRERSKLPHLRGHVPPPPALHLEAVAGLHDRAHAVPFHLEPPAAATRERRRAAQHRLWERVEHASSLRRHGVSTRRVLSALRLAGSARVAGDAAAAGPAPRRVPRVRAVVNSDERVPDRKRAATGGVTR
jgi:hypothetical protein